MKRHHVQYLNGQETSVFILEHADTVKTHLHCGGLASSIVTKQRGDMALIERNIKVLNACTVAIKLAETKEANTHWEL